MDLKLRRCTSSSQQVVLDEEDLLTLILLCVPYRKLMSFKSVSKKWLSLITNPHFTRLLGNLLPPLRASGLFIQRPPSIGSPHKVYFVPLDDKNIPSPFKTLTFAHDPFNPENIRILQSCKGLLLCSSAFHSPHGERNDYVYNPSTSNARNIPFYDMSASTPEKAYPLEKIIEKGEWYYLSDLLDISQGAEVAPDAYPIFVCNRVHKLENIKPCLGVTLVVDGYRSDTSHIAKDLEMSAVSLKTHYAKLGCKFVLEKSALLATLPVPLIFEEFMGKKKRQS